MNYYLTYFNKTIISFYLPSYRNLNEENFKVILIGGLIDTETHSLTGHLAEASIEQTRSDIAFIGCDSVSPDLDVMFSSYDISRLVKIILKFAVVKVLVADHTKFGKVNISSAGKISELDKIIVDSGLSSEYIEKINRTGKQLII